MHMNQSTLFVVLMLALGFISSSQAQIAPPDAGKLDRPRVEIPPPSAPPKIVTPQRPESPSRRAGGEVDEPTLQVNSFQFTGYLTLTSAAKLQTLVQDERGKLHTLKELHRISDKVERYLQTELHLVVAKAWVPLQDVADGVVEIRILQGTVNKLKTDPKFQLNPKHERVLAVAQSVIEKGSAVESERLEEAVYRVSDYLGTPVRVVLVPIETLGEYDVLFEMEDQAKLSGSVAIDNTGNRYTSQWHETVGLKLSDLSGNADQLSLHAQLLTPNQRSLRLNYQIPLSQGYRIGATYQASRYHLCCAFEPLDARGETKLMSVDVNRAWLRSRLLNVYVNAEAVHRQLVNRQFGITTSDHTVKQVSLGMKADWNQAQTLNYAYVTLTSGNVDLANAGADSSIDQTTARLEGQFGKLNIGYSRTQAISEDSNFVVNLNAQLASKNLDSSETFLLGGMGAIRAYPSGEVAGDQSVVGQFEYHKNLTAAARVFGFYDHGWIQLHKKPWQLTNAKNDLQFKGLGVGAVWKPMSNVELSLIAALKLGTNPIANQSTGNDSDGRSSRYRIWAFSSIRF